MRIYSLSWINSDVGRGTWDVRRETWDVGLEKKDMKKDVRPEYIL